MFVSLLRCDEDSSLSLPLLVSLPISLSQLESGKGSRFLGRFTRFRLSGNAVSRFIVLLFLAARQLSESFAGEGPMPWVLEEFF